MRASKISDFWSRIILCCLHLQIANVWSKLVNPFGYVCSKIWIFRRLRTSQWRFHDSAAKGLTELCFRFGDNDRKVRKKDIYAILDNSTVLCECRVSSLGHLQDFSTVGLTPESMTSLHNQHRDRSDSKIPPCDKNILYSPGVKNCWLYWNLVTVVFSFLSGKYIRQRQHLRSQFQVSRSLQKDVILSVHLEIYKYLFKIKNRFFWFKTKHCIQKRIMSLTRVAFLQMAIY